MSNVVGQCCRAQDPTSDPGSRRLQRLTVHECREMLRFSRRNDLIHEAGWTDAIIWLVVRAVGGRDVERCAGASECSL